MRRLTDDQLLDPSRLYQWFIIAERRLTKLGHEYQLLRYQCVTESAIVREQHHLPHGEADGALRHMMDELGLASFVLGTHFYAKVSPRLTSDGRVIYSFIPHSYRLAVSSNDSCEAVSSKASCDPISSKASNEAVIHQVVCDAISSKASYKDIIQQLEQMGPEYVKAYRLQRKAGAGV